MQSIAFTAPLLPGKTATAREAMQCMQGERKAAYDASRQWLGIARESVWVQQAPGGDVAVGQSLAHPEQRHGQRAPVGHELDRAVEFGPEQRRPILAQGRHALQHVAAGSDTVAQQVHRVGQLGLHPGAPTLVARGIPQVRQPRAEKGGEGAHQRPTHDELGRSADEHAAAE
jgi:hypothetical protein